MGLNPMCTNIRGQILHMDPLPTVNKIYSLLLQEEKQGEALNDDGTGTGSHAEAFAFAARNNLKRFGRNYAPKNPHLKCGKCNKVSYTSEMGHEHRKCEYCGLQGLVLDVCRKLQRNNRQERAQEFCFKYKPHRDQGIPQSHHWTIGKSVEPSC